MPVIIIFISYRLGTQFYPKYRYIIIIVQKKDPLQYII